MLLLALIHHVEAMKFLKKLESHFLQNHVLALIHHRKAMQIF